MSQSKAVRSKLPLSVHQTFHCLDKAVYVTTPKKRGGAHHTILATFSTDEEALAATEALRAVLGPQATAPTVPK